MTERCSQDGCTEPAEFSAPLDLRAGHLNLRFRLQLCPEHAGGLPWLVRLRDPRAWDCGLLLEQIEEEVVT